VVGPDTLREAQRVTRLQQEDAGLAPGDAVATLGAQFVLLERARVHRLRDRRQARRQAAPLDHHDARLRPDGVHEVVVAIDLPLLAVEGLDALVGLAADAEVRHVRARHAPPVVETPSCRVVRLWRGRVHARSSQRRRRRLAAAGSDSAGRRRAPRARQPEEPQRRPRTPHRRQASPLRQQDVTLRRDPPGTADGIARTAHHAWAFE
jgi:hypothetical protein